MYYVYILKCIDGTLYTGITRNLEKRLFEHNYTEKGAKYTRNRRPVKIVYFKEYPDRSLASKEEFRIKKMSKSDKLDLISNSDL